MQYANTMAVGTGKRVAKPSNQERGLLGVQRCVRHIMFQFAVESSGVLLTQITELEIFPVSMIFGRDKVVNRYSRQPTVIKSHVQILSAVVLADTGRSWTPSWSDGAGNQVQSVIPGVRLVLICLFRMLLGKPEMSQAVEGTCFFLELASCCEHP